MDLIDITGIGDKTINLLNKLGIYNVDDLINYYPYRYEIIKRSNINELIDGDKIIIDGIIENKATIAFFGRMKKITFRLNTGSSIMNVNIYNQIYLFKNLTIGRVITVIGKYDSKKNLISAYEIRFSKLDNNPKIECVYHTTSGLKRSILKKAIDNAVNKNINYIDYIPDYIKEKYNFLDKKTSILEIHNPTSFDLLKNARLRLKYEELFIYMLKMNYLKKKIKDSTSLLRIIDKKKIDIFINSLPFKLTEDQLKSIKEIINDLTSNKKMNRLLQGDVGSGKTIVAFVACYANYISGYGSAIMVPTEILAYQHYNNAIKLFKDTDMKIEVLTSSIKVSAKKEIYRKLENNEIDLIIGTQSLIQEGINYNNLGLVITDEQHRFGVNQRSYLKNKGLSPDILSMSATPIPRTYALTIFGDMDVSNIRTKPIGRKEIITYLKKESEITSVLELMYKELINNHQIYVIAPMIEENDTEIENVKELEIKMNKAFGKKYVIKSIHGKLKTTEKDKIMEEFSNNTVNILISTTVIEVGVDIKNASMIVIFDANNFGLSTIHQLRGRVGRSDIQSYCILVTKNECERLKILTETNDGFEISEYDFKNRGFGDLFGIKQSGDLFFNLADLKVDYKILVQAKEDATDFIKVIENDKNKYKEITNRIKEINNLD